MMTILLSTDAHKKGILSGMIRAQVYLKDFCRLTFKVGDWITPEFPPGTPIGTFQIAEVRECVATEISFQEACDAGFDLWHSLVHELHRQYSSFELESTRLIFIRWEPILKSCEECDQRDQT